MGIDKELKRPGFEFGNERSEREAPVEIWIDKKTGWVCGLSGSSWGGDIMKVEIQRLELALLDQTTPEELAEVLVELIKNNREIQRAILGEVWKCPNVLKQI